MKLRQLAIKDSQGMLEWMKSKDINQYFRINPADVTVETVQKFINESFTDINKNYAIVDSNDEYLGTISLKNIDSKNNNAEYAISLRECAKGTGVAKLATIELLNIAFKTLNLNKVYLNVLSKNIRAIKFYEKIGFEYEGEFLDHFYINGKYENIKWYGVRKVKFEK
ncbi:GNAT family N-acetyltransferase [Marinilactibacillus kalidii]|uniref:GNAT family N-acetyltransferase n=1 Tax=Marinilactibacillus kalidii TaxID=2820274 RepID=UPI001ABEA717|nr:GNAT family N-acetyltransferase [Marinilactibacillus kalidii]